MRNLVWMSPIETRRKIKGPGDLFIFNTCTAAFTASLGMVQRCNRLPISPFFLQWAVFWVQLILIIKISAVFQPTFHHLVALSKECVVLVVDLQCSDLPASSQRLHHAESQSAVVPCHALIPIITFDLRLSSCPS